MNAFDAFSRPPLANPQLSRDYQRQRQMTLGDLLLENRIIFLQGEIHDGNANELVMKMLYLQSENRRKDINFYINSPGGSVSATLAIYDTMQILKLSGDNLLRWSCRKRWRCFACRWNGRENAIFSPTPKS